MDKDMTMFGEKFYDTIAQARKIKPEATNVWLQQLGEINPLDFQAIFDKIPSARIEPKAKTFALELVQHNQRQILEQNLIDKPTKQADNIRNIESIVGEATPSTKQENLIAKLTASQTRIQLIPQLAATIKKQLDDSKTDNLQVDNYQVGWNQVEQKLTLIKGQQIIAIARLKNNQWESMSVPPSSITLSSEDLRFWQNRNENITITKEEKSTKVNTKKSSPEL